MRPQLQRSDPPDRWTRGEIVTVTLAIGVLIGVAILVSL